MPRFRNIRKMASAVTDTADRMRDASKEALPSVDTGQLSQRVRDISERAVNTARSPTPVSQEVLDAANARVASLTEQALGLSNEAIDKLFPECSAPMYIMPTGPGQEDYVLVFQFDEIIENLNVGVLVRPKIEAWSSGGNSYDLDRLSEEIQREFTNQFAQARESPGPFCQGARSRCPKII